MPKSPSNLRLCAVFFTATLTGLPAAESNPQLQAMNDALLLRSEMVTGIVQGKEKPATALARLQAQPSASTRKLDSSADFAFAAIDLGQRLISAGKPAAAEIFFLAAEKALVLVSNKTPDTEIESKTQYLQQLAYIRARYLNNVGQARKDIERAISLMPTDAYLRSMREHLSHENAETFKDIPNG